MRGICHEAARTDFAHERIDLLLGELLEALLDDGVLIVAQLRQRKEQKSVSRWLFVIERG